LQILGGGHQPHVVDTTSICALSFGHPFSSCGSVKCGFYYILLHFLIQYPIAMSMASHIEIIKKIQKVIKVLFIATYYGVHASCNLSYLRREKWLKKFRQYFFSSNFQQ
jgi:hypothetical protein